MNVYLHVHLYMYMLFGARVLLILYPCRRGEACVLSYCCLKQLLQGIHSVRESCLMCGLLTGILYEPRPDGRAWEPRPEGRAWEPRPQAFRRELEPGNLFHRVLG